MNLPDASTDAYDIFGKFAQKSAIPFGMLLYNSARDFNGRDHHIRAFIRCILIFAYERQEEIQMLRRYGIIRIRKEPYGTPRGAHAFAYRPSLAFVLKIEQGEMR